MRLPATYPLGYASVAPLPAALLDGLFEQPPKKTPERFLTSFSVVCPPQRTAHGKRAVPTALGWAGEKVTPRRSNSLRPCHRAFLSSPEENTLHHNPACPAFPIFFSKYITFRTQKAAEHTEGQRVTSSSNGPMFSHFLFHVTGSPDLIPTVFVAQPQAHSSSPHAPR